MYKYPGDVVSINSYLNEYLSMEDYYWFVTSLIESVDKKWRVEIMDDDTGDVETYYIKSFMLSFIPGKEGNSDNISLELEDYNTHSLVTFEINDTGIDKVKENSNSAPGKFCKYYVDSDNERYRFVFFAK